MTKRLALDTNALIALSAPAHPLFLRIEEAIMAGAQATTNAVAWHEYVRGPLTNEDRRRALVILQDQILPLEQTDAELAAQLFNATGRRASTADCLIAAITIHNQAQLITNNLEDFRRFKPYGLQLIE